MLNSLYQFKKELNQKGIFFCFCGPISQALLVEIGDTLRYKMKLEETSSATIIKVFSVFVEQAQNIIHYSAETTPVTEIGNSQLRSGIIIVGYEQEHYYVLCGNMIANQMVNPLQEQLDKLQKMNKEELKQYYKQQRKEKTPQESKGAGLGFIELARKSIQPIDFYFQPVDHNYTFFSLKTII
jgi:hypothetical protein